MEKLANQKTIQERLIEARGLVAKDLDSARTILQGVILDNKNDFYLMEINCVSNIIREEELYQELTLDQKTHYHCLKTVGKDFYNLGDYERAFYHYELAKDETNHPIFDYYLGKMLYKQGRYLEALPYFQEYFSHGGEKMEKCLIYMLKIYAKQGSYKRVHKISSKIHKLNDTFKSGVYLRFHKKHYNPFYDHVKNVAMKDTKVSLDEFGEETGLEVESYNQCSFHQKLIVIKNLMVQDQFRLAESYLRNMVPETEEDRKELVQFQKNKRIYKNQGK